MTHYTKGECTLDTISATDYCMQGSQLNLCAFLLQELFEACEDKFKRATRFIYGYLIMALDMWKWCPPGKRPLSEIGEDQPVAFRYPSWRVSGDPNSKEINDEAFKDWYNMMLDVIQTHQRIPRVLLDEYFGHIWFGILHGNTWIRP